MSAWFHYPIAVQHAARAQRFCASTLSSDGEAPATGIDPAARITCRCTGASILEEPDGRAMFCSYEIQVRIGQSSWQIHRRFRACFELFENLERRLPDDVLPPMPPRRCFWRSIDPDVVKERVCGIDAWLQRVCGMLQFDSCLIAFLEVERQLLCAAETDSIASSPSSSPSPSRKNTERGLDSPNSTLTLDLQHAAASPTTLLVVPTGSDDAKEPRDDPFSTPMQVHLLPQPAEPVCMSCRTAAGCLTAALSRTLRGTVPYASLRRVVDHLCRDDGAFHPAMMVVAAAYFDRLGAVPGMAALLSDDRWQLVTAALLLIASKSYSDAPASVASLCSVRSPYRHGWPALRKAAVSAVERRLLFALDFRTTVVLAEYEFVAACRCEYGAEAAADVCA